MSSNVLIPSDGSDSGRELSNGYPYGYPPATDFDGSASHSQISLSFILAALRRRWKICLPLGLLLAIGAALAIWMFMEPEYQGIANLEVSSSEPYLAYRSPDAADRRSRFRNTQAQIAMSTPVLSEVIDSLSPAELDLLPRQRDQQIAWLKEKIAVTALSQSEIFQVSFTCTNPAMAKSVVEKVVEHYLRQRQVMDEYEDGLVRLGLIEKRLAEHEASYEVLLDEKGKILKKIYSTDNTDVLFDENGARIGLGSPLGELERRRGETRLQITLDEEERKELESSLDDPPPAPPEELVEASVDLDPRILFQQAKVTETKRQYEETLAKAPDLPVVKRLKRDWDAERDALDVLRSQVRPEIQDTMQRTMAAQSKARAIQRIADIKASRRNLDSFMEAIDEQIEEKRAELERLAVHKSELDEVEDELEFAKGPIAELKMQQTRLTTERGAPAQVRPFGPVLLPTEPVSTAVPYILLVCVLSICAPFALAIGWEFLTHKISSSRDLSSNGAINVIGEITQFPSRRLAIDSDLEGTPIYEESVDQVCAALMYSPQTENKRILAVCSAVSGEGKTSVATQLAMSFARSCPERVLLIDADLRDPDIANLFRIDDSPGLADVLANRCSAREAIVTDWGAKLHLLPAGYLTARPQSLFGQGRFREVLKELAAGYDYVVIDTPPVLCASEALAIAKAADGTIVCSMRDKSRASQVTAAINRIREAGGDHVGCVLSGIPRKDYLYHYGNYAKAYAIEQNELDDRADWEESNGADAPTADE